MLILWQRDNIDAYPHNPQYFACRWHIIFTMLYNARWSNKRCQQQQQVTYVSSTSHVDTQEPGVCRSDSPQLAISCCRLPVTVCTSGSEPTNSPSRLELVAVANPSITCSDLTVQQCGVLSTCRVWRHLWQEQHGGWRCLQQSQSDRSVTLRPICSRNTVWQSRLFILLSRANLTWPDRHRYETWPRKEEEKKKGHLRRSSIAFTAL